MEEEYLGTPNGECEQGSTISLKGLLELGGKGGKGVIVKAGLIGGKFAKAEYLFCSLDDVLIANGFTEGFPSRLFPLFLKGLPVMALEEGLMMIFPARFIASENLVKNYFHL